MKTNKIILTGLFLAMALVLPQIFHPLNMGKIISPMHFPVLICGLLLGYKYGLLCGILAPLVGGLLFEMPQLYPVGLAMAVELGLYGLIGPLLYQNTRIFKNTTIRLYMSLGLAIIVGRLASAFVNSILVLLDLSTTNFHSYMSILFIVGMPGIILQLLIIPPIVLRLPRLGEVASE